MLGVWSEPPTFDPHLASSPVAILVATALFTGLVDQDAAGQIVPGVAQSWNVSTDGLSYVFKLRETRWSDDTPITARDFELSFRRLFSRALRSPAARDYTAIANGEAVLTGRLKPDRLGVRALAPDVLEIALDRPLPALLGLLAQPAAAPVPPHLLRRHGARWAEPGRLVGNGAFTLGAWQPGEPLVLRANPQFLDAASVALSSVTLAVQVGPDAATQSLSAGRLHILETQALPMVMLDNPGGFGPVDLRIDPLWGLTALVLQQSKGPLQSLDLRRALSMAISPAALVNQGVAQGRTVATSLIPPRLPSYPTPQSPPWATWTPEQRQTEAARLLTQAGYGPGTPLALRLRVSTQDEDRKLAASIDAQLRPLGVELTVFIAEPDRHLEALRDGDFDLARRTWVVPADDPDSFLGLYACKARPLNISGACSAEADALVTQAAQEADPPERAALLQRAEQVMVADVPAIPLYAPANRTLVSRSVLGWQTNPTGQHRLRWLSLSRPGLISRGPA